MVKAILLYYLIGIITIVIIKNDYDRYNYFRKQEKIKATSVAVICFIWTFYNIVVTCDAVDYSSDRHNYVLNFEGIRETPSLGLLNIIYVLRYVNASPDQLFFLTSFICVLLTLISYRSSRDAKPVTILLLLSSQYVLMFLVNLKQAYAVAFASISIMLAIEHNGLKNLILEFLFDALAFIFHPAAFILFIVSCVLRCNKIINNNFIVLIGLGLVFIFFDNLMNMMSVVIGQIIPDISNKIDMYFGDNQTIGAVNGEISFVKGIPFYIIFVYGIINKYKYKHSIDDINKYNKYLFVSGLVVIFYLANIYNYWMSRFCYFFYFIDFVFFTQILAREKNKLIAAAMFIFVLMQLMFITTRYIYICYQLDYGF